ncbi:ADP-ribosylglycohydrolase family protein [Brevibacillus sp. NPDC058079]|uniref:ADP-ribosylglycohydrolase family protein n=1 Tax=Brevibacillus sp. NPDC058079 TaxID=3346330 RepID=UPI0036E6901C
MHSQRQKIKFDLINITKATRTSFDISIDSLTRISLQNYEEAVLLAVNLGGDTDTIGAITGGMAGVHYGTKAMPAKWIKTIARKHDSVQLVDHFYATLTHETTLLS